MDCCRWVLKNAGFSQSTSSMGAVGTSSAGVLILLDEAFNPGRRVGDLIFGRPVLFGPHGQTLGLAEGSHELVFISLRLAEQVEHKCF